MPSIHGYITPIAKVVMTTVIGSTMQTQARYPEFIQPIAVQYYEVDGVAPTGFLPRQQVLDDCNAMIAAATAFEANVAAKHQTELRAKISVTTKIAVTHTVYGECKDEAN